MLCAACALHHNIYVPAETVMSLPLACLILLRALTSLIAHQQCSLEFGSTAFFARVQLAFARTIDCTIMPQRSALNVKLHNNMCVASLYVSSCRQCDELTACVLRTFASLKFRKLFTNNAAGSLGLPISSHACKLLSPARSISPSFQNNQP